MIPTYSNFSAAIAAHIDKLQIYGREVDVGRWQGVPTAGKPDLTTIELMDVAFRVPMPRILYPEPLLDLAEDICPNLPWADDHFLERVSRQPTNPGEQYKNWPWWRGQDESAMETFHLGPGKTEPQVPQVYERKFTHTYQERFWPKWAPEEIHKKYSPQGDIGLRASPGSQEHAVRGIRYPYGDLDDLVDLLLREPYTRQAYLPIFFPEDTGSVHGGRVPCTLGYHFMLRDFGGGPALHMWYTIRSCDVIRHFRDDLYLAARLLLWVVEACEQRRTFGTPSVVWDDVKPGIFSFHAYSLHIHKGDQHLLKSDPRDR